MADRRNYFVKDHYGIVWNDEPFLTFRQAHEFKGYIIPQINDARSFSIHSQIREKVEQVSPPPQPKPTVRENYAANLEF